jgi:NADH-quinone oxidoreductase subunit F
LLGTYAIGSKHAFIYIRGEFQRGYEIFCAALAEARAAGLVGSGLFGTQTGIEVTVHRGAGAYICGEETALLNSLEGRRGEPRLKPPFPAVKGLYGEPTVVNNVETLATLPHLLKNGAEWFAKVGPEKSPGYKIVSVSGHVKKPGNYEVPLGTPLRELLEIAGGPREGRRIVAVQPGGGSSACLFEEHLDLPYDFDTMAQNGTMLGSGAVVFFDDTTNFVEAALALVRFYAHESCGQCTPCREGGHWLEITLERILHGGGLASDIDMLVSVSHQLTGINLCPLGDSIEPFLASVVKRFEAQFRSYVAPAPVAV